MVKKLVALAAVALAVLVGYGFVPLDRVGVGAVGGPAAMAPDLHPEWAAHLAPSDRCPHAGNPYRPIEEQEETMLCLLNFARRREGLRPLPRAAVLSDSARLKAHEIVDCREFAHAACGKVPDAGARALGFDGAFGENIAWGQGFAGAPRVIVDSWLASPGHRENLFRPAWSKQGIAVKRGWFKGVPDALVWVSQFGEES